MINDLGKQLILLFKDFKKFKIWHKALIIFTMFLIGLSIFFFVCYLSIEGVKFLSVFSMFLSTAAMVFNCLSLANFQRTEWELDEYLRQNKRD